MQATASEANRQAQSTWNRRPCGLRDVADFDRLKGRTFYKTIAARRYGHDDPWVPEVLDFPAMAGRKVLELGHGMGCDLATAALNGAIAHGVDLTPRHHEIAKRTLADAGVSADLHLCNAGALPFASESMDTVYSIGVLHHTDNIEQCIREARRVLKPGGTFIVAVYHFWSLAHLYHLVKGVRSGQLFHLGYRDFLSTVEAGADGVEIKPLVKLSSRDGIRKLLAEFSTVEISIRGLASYRKIPGVGRFISTQMAARLERWWGWYVVVRATK